MSSEMRAFRMFAPFPQPCHPNTIVLGKNELALQLTFEPVCIATKQLHEFGILDTVEKFNGFRVVRAGNGPVESVSSKQ